MKTIALKVVIEVPDNYVMDEPEWTLEDSILNRDSECEIVSVDEFPKFKPSENYTKPMSPDKYIGTVPVSGWSIQNIPDTIKNAYEDGKNHMDAEWHDVIKQYCEKHGIDFWDFIRDIHMMFSDAQEDGSESEEYSDEDSSEEDDSENKSGLAVNDDRWPGNFYLVNVPGKHGYSFMVKTVLEDESDILEKCSEMKLFNDEEDVFRASVSEADKYDQEHFKEFDYLYS